MNKEANRGHLDLPTATASSAQGEPQNFLIYRQNPPLALLQKQA